MTLKQFVQWCEDRVADGRLTRKEATVCSFIIQDVNAHPFWRRKKVWRKWHDSVVREIVEPINLMMQGVYLSEEKLDRVIIEPVEKGVET